MLVSICVLLLLVTVSGIVGITALRVAQRRKQIGVRRALGARWRDILRYFIVENVIITTGGIVAGLLSPSGLNRFLMAQVGHGAAAARVPRVRRGRALDARDLRGVRPRVQGRQHLARHRHRTA
jgi:ABC-type antimicrobial peptide transport system permease subunit